MKEPITFDDFLKLDIRVGTIINAEDILKSKKLLKLSVDFGTEIGTRTIMAGVAGNYTAESIKGQRVVAVINLAPRSMMGVESHGMLMASHDAEGKVWLAIPGPVPDGSEVS